MISLVTVFGTCKYNVQTSKRNVPLSETTVRMGHSSVVVVVVLFCFLLLLLFFFFTTGEN